MKALNVRSHILQSSLKVNKKRLQYIERCHYKMLHIIIYTYFVVQEEKTTTIRTTIKIKKLNKKLTII